MTAPALALCAVMRLGQALERHALASAAPRRVAQLHAVRGLDSQIGSLQRRLERQGITPAAALREVIRRFAEAESAIGADLDAILGAEPAAVAPGTTMLTAAYGRGAVA